MVINIIETKVVQNYCLDLVSIYIESASFDIWVGVGAILWKVLWLW